MGGVGTGKMKVLKLVELFDHGPELVPRETSKDFEGLERRGNCGDSIVEHINGHINPFDPNLKRGKQRASFSLKALECMMLVGMVSTLRFFHRE